MTITYVTSGAQGVPHCKGLYYDYNTEVLPAGADMHCAVEHKSMILPLARYRGDPSRHSLAVLKKDHVDCG
jgi:hypothetical protein